MERTGCTQSLLSPTSAITGHYPSSRTHNQLEAFSGSRSVDRFVSHYFMKSTQKLCVNCVFFSGLGDCSAQPDLVIGGARKDNVRGVCKWQREEPWPFDLLLNTCGQRGRFFKANVSRQRPLPAERTPENHNQRDSG
jgi:hypothetical protein